MRELTIISGTDVARTIREELRKKIISKHLSPGLAIVLIGDDPASTLYVKLKKKASNELGIHFHEYLIDKKCPEDYVTDTINWLNTDKTIHGIVIQLPLPKNFNEDKIIALVDPMKDADGYHPKNLTRYKRGIPYVEPALIQSVMRLIEETGENIEGKKSIIVANSTTFADPMQIAFKSHGVSSAFVKPNDVSFLKTVKESDIVIVAVGKPGIIKDEDCKYGAIVIDVGINKENGKTCGDVDLPENLDEVKNIKWVTPVPGGVGPVTIAMLLKNVVHIASQV